MRIDNHTSIFYIALEYAVLAASLGLAGASWFALMAGQTRLAVFVPIALAAIVIVATVQHRLSGLGHEAGHYTLFRNKLANELVSDIFLMFPIFGMTQRFRNSHLGHHRYVNDPRLDPDVLRLNAREAQRFPVSPWGFCVRYLVKGLWPPALWGYLFGQAKGANAKVGGGVVEVPAPYRFRLGRLMRGTYWFTVLTLVHAFRLWPLFVLFWVVPLLTVYPLLMQIREIAHHSNAPDDGRFTNSRVFLVHPIIRAAVFPYGQDFHLTHHLFALLPHHKIARAHNELLRYAPYREHVIVCRGFFLRPRGSNAPTVLEVLSRQPRAGELLWDGLPRVVVDA
jgi:fatty acid desaturase